MEYDYIHFDTKSDYMLKRACRYTLIIYINK